MKKLALIDYVILIFWPFYFILHTLACYRAIWEGWIAPFRWNKTEHGISATELDE